MNVTLEPPLTSSLPSPRWPGQTRQRALRTAPPYARSRGMSRWHRIRSGLIYEPPARPIFVAYHLWCGQSISSHRETTGGNEAGFITSPGLPTDGVPVCGTCEGRAIGAGHQPLAAEVTAPGGLLFQPDRLDRPKVCPAVGTKHWHRSKLWDQHPDLGWPWALCFCGESVRTWGETVRSHAPGDLLPDGCEFHAWRGLALVEGQVVCLCRTEYREAS